MKNTSMIWEKEFDLNYAVGHDTSGKAYEFDRRTNARAAGSMTTTASDYAKFIIGTMGQKILSKNLQKELFTPQIKISSKRGFGPQRDSLITANEKIQLAWGLSFGFFNSKYGKGYFHGGHDDDWQNYAVCFPQSKLAIVIMTNSSNYEPAAASILNQCIGDVYSPLEWLGY